MKTYYDLNEYHIKLGKTVIPKKEDHWDYIQFLEEIKNGEAELVPYKISWEEFRSKRDALLRDSDWSAFPDANPKPSKEAWLTYRQALRDIPQTFSSPEEVVFPSKPV